MLFRLVVGDPIITRTDFAGRSWNLDLRHSAMAAYDQGQRVSVLVLDGVLQVAVANRLRAEVDKRPAVLRTADVAGGDGEGSPEDSGGASAAKPKIGDRAGNSLLEARRPQIRQQPAEHRDVVLVVDLLSRPSAAVDLRSGAKLLFQNV